MKFLCDRCNTRYSIGDERVRGKILKIRCKSCGNVITVREGMTADPDAAPAEVGARPRKTTTGAPAALEDRGSPPTGGAPAPQPVTQKLGRAARAEQAGGNRGAKEAEAPASPAVAGRAMGGREPAAGRGGAGRDPVAARAPTEAVAQPRRGAAADAARGHAAGPRGEPGNALNAASASAPARPAPAALEEEWYVSVDGEQAGPFSLADAQRWVAQQVADAELHCWSEGFDDWLPVDKVSHFRGLRKRPAVVGAPPPLPRAGAAARGAGAAAAPGPRAEEDDPKPLFAATMASLERGGPAMPTTGLGLPPPAEAPAHAIPPRGKNGAGAPLSGPDGKAPRDTNPGARIDGRAGDRPEARSDAKVDARVDPGPGAAIDARIDARAAAIAAQAAARSPFANPFDVSEGGDAATQLEAPPFEDAPIPARAPRLEAGGAPDMPVAAMTAAPAASDFGDGDLDIGEVSRVVNLADISRTSRSTDRTTGVRGAGSPSAGRSTGASPTARATSALPSQTATGAPFAPGDPSASMAPVVRAHRRGLIVLLVVAGVLVLCVIGAVVVFVTNDDDTPGGSLGAVHDIDTSRPEDPTAHRPPGSGGTVPVSPAPVPPRTAPRPRTGPATPGNQVAEAPPSGGLATDEIEDVARKNQDMTQRCYMRSQRGADAILVGDVKKIAVTLTIDRGGNVSELQLSEHAADTLGKCLSSAIRGWKFRPSSGGTYRISLAFAPG